MISWLSDWVQQIVLIVLIAGFVDLILPNTAMERYVKLVMGLLIILAILSPLLGLLGKEYDLSELALQQEKESRALGMDSLRFIQSKSEELKKTQMEQIDERTIETMKSMIQQQLKQHFSIQTSEVVIALHQNEQQTKEIKSIYVMITELKDDETQVNHIEPVKPIQIGKDMSQKVEDEPSDEVKKQLDEIQHYLMRYWGLNPEQVVVKQDGSEGGN
ncbi:stage III sporulation protein AF [Hazenella sp. IB182357]|uniref:Stage III sporulation protein AF n=1 Tax=Polycladospora coralii TaxID=2771432 RepID=A0A926NB28_9BACL|nr:stage III sporulation protein AF [Polycladospora coralii]